MAFGILSCLTLPFTVLCGGYKFLSCCCTGSMGADGVKAYQAKIYYVAFLAFGTLIGFLFGQIAQRKVEGDSSKLEDAIFKFSMECVINETTNDISCNGNPAILRVSFASVLFFSAMLLGTIPVPTFSGDDSWRPLLGEGFHRGFWGIKLVIYFGLVIGSFFFGFFNDDAYTGVARFVSIVFLIAQVLVLIDFAYIWNETWIERSDVENDFADGSKGWLIVLILCAALLYIAGFGWFIGAFVLFQGCASTLGIHAFNFLLAIAGVALTLLKPYYMDDEVSGSILPPAVVAAYISYLSFSAAQSNPDLSSECDPFNNKLGQNGGEIFLSIVIATISLIWMALTVSGNAESLLGGGGSDDRAGPADVGGAYEIEEADGTTKYARDADGGAKEEDDSESTGDKLWFFHVIMITASFYMAMVLTNWGVSEQDVQREGQQIGEISMYSKAVASWVAGLLFIWTIVAPAIMPDRFD